MCQSLKMRLGDIRKSLLRDFVWHKQNAAGTCLSKNNVCVNIVHKGILCGCVKIFRLRKADKKKERKRRPRHAKQPENSCLNRH